MMKIQGKVGISLFITLLSIVCLFYFSFIFDQLLIIYLGLPFSFALFFFVLSVLNYPTTDLHVTIKQIYLVPSLLYLVTLLSIGIIIFVAPFDGTMFDWANLPLANLLRYISTVLLTSFLPGYFLIKIIDRKDAFGIALIVTLSFLLSVFSSCSIAFVLLVAGQSLETTVPFYVVCTNFGLLLAHFIVRKLCAVPKREFQLKINWLEAGVVVCILTMMTTALLTVMFTNMPLTAGDMTSNHGTSIDFFNGLPISGGKLITYSGGYGFPLYLATVFVLSGMPSALAEQGLFILCLIPLISFFGLIKFWFKDKDDLMPSKILFLSVLLGFGGLYALYLRFVSPTFNIFSVLYYAISKTYDISMRILFLPDIVAALWLIGLPVLFALLVLIKKDCPLVVQALVIPVLVCFGYLGHASEIFIFLCILFVYSLIIRQQNEPKIGKYVLLGLLLVAAIDYVAPAQTYVVNNVTGAPSSAFFVSLTLSVSLIVIEYIKDQYPSFLLTSRKLVIGGLRKSWPYMRWILLYSYLLLIVIWLIVQKDYNVWAWGADNYVPFFILPIRLGIVGLFAVATIFLYFGKILRNHTLRLFFCLMPIGFIFEQLSNYYAFYPAIRFGTLTFIGAIVLSAYGITRFASDIRIHKRLKIAFGVISVVFIILAMLSSALYYVNSTFYSKDSSISPEEAHVFDYLRNNMPSNSSVLTFTAESANKLRNFAGINAVQDAERWSELFSASNPSVVNYILGSSNVRYIYLDYNDLYLANQTFFASFLPYFEVVYKSGYITLYEVQSLTPPSYGASLAILYPIDSPQQQTAPTWVDDTFDQGWDFSRKYGDVKSYQSTVTGGLWNITCASNSSTNCWASYHLSGLSINTSVYSDFSFRYLVENKLTWFTIQLYNSTNSVFCYCGHLQDTNFAVKNVVLPENQTITRIEVIAETTTDATAETVASVLLDYIAFSNPVKYLKETVLPSLFVSLIGSNYSSILETNMDSNSLGDLIKSYTAILLPSDPVIPNQHILDWLSNGNSLVVFNTGGNGFFGDLFSINNLSSTISSYQYNDGKVIYINTNSVSLDGNLSNLLTPSLLESTRNQLNITYSSPKTETLPIYNSAFNNILVDGTLKIDTNNLILQGQLNLSCVVLPVEPQESIQISGAANVTASKGVFSIYPSESYLIIKSDYAIDGSITSASNQTYILLGQNKIHFPYGSSFVFNGTAIIQTRLPSITAVGTIRFDELDVHSSLYVPIAGIVQKSAQIDGSVKFGTNFISYPVIIFSYFTVQGTIQSIAETSFSHLIVWSDILKSPYFIIYTLLFIAILCVYHKPKFWSFLIKESAKSTPDL